MAIRIGRTSSTTVSFSTPQEVVISHLDDSIRIGDGTDLVTTTTVGPKVGLDVNLIGGAVLPATTPKMYNIPVGTTEVSQALSANTKRFILRNRDNGRTQVAYVSGESGTKYLTVAAGAVYSETDLDLTSVTIYMRCSKAAQTIEILEWT